MLYLFKDYVLDPDRRELRAKTGMVPVEPQVFDLLLLLVRNRDRVVSRDELVASVWGGRAVSGSTLDSRINAARKAVGDSGERQDVIRTIPRRGIRFVGAVRQAEEQLDATPARSSVAVKQQVSFCRGPENINIAYATVGSGPPLIKAANWLTHIEYDWDSPVWSPLLQWLAERTHLVRYDSRGNGLSDRNVEDISFAGFVRDFECVVNATGLDRFAILGISQGAGIGIDYAMRYPERVSKLVLYGGYALGRYNRVSDDERAKAETFLAMLRHGWGDERSAFMRAFASVFIPNGSPEQIRWFADLQRMTTTAENAARIRRACDNIDVLEALPKLQVPTLVLHSRHDNVVPLEQGRLLAARIPNARFVTLDSDNHVLLSGEPGWPHFLQEVEAFLES